MERCNRTDKGLTPDSYGLHALVLQSSRGEVAAVDVRAWRVLDSRSDIPGKTFVPTGSVPVGIAVAPDHPHVMYVANSGSREISVIRTAAAMVVSTQATIQSVPLRLPDSEAADVPYDLAISPDQDALFVTSRAGHWLIRIPILRKQCATTLADAGVMPNAAGAASEEAAEPCDYGELDESAIVRIPLEQSWSKLPPEAFMPGAADSGAEPYRFTCQADGIPPLLETPAVPPQLPSADTDIGMPEPAGMSVDAFCDAGSCTRRLLIADAHQPIVHAIDIDKLTSGAPEDAVLEPILTGAPSERVAVTPPVPVDLESDAETQYVYAIDARDGSVIVTQGGRVKNVGVDASMRADRLDLGSSGATASTVAMSLAVLTPNFKVNGAVVTPPDSTALGTWVSMPAEPLADYKPLECVDNIHQVRSSERLRGVFLAVGATDGTVRIINVHDMDLRECRSCNIGEMWSYQPFKSGYDPLPVVRNNPRLVTYAATDITSAPVIAPSVVPQFVVNGAAIGVKADGTTNDTRVAGLDCIACSDDQAISFPTDETVTGGVTTADGGVPEEGACSAGQGRICSIADPYVEPRNWQAVYEGPIPGTLGGRGRFIPRSSPDNKSGALEFVGDTAFCQVGVLGDDQLGAGDQLAITSPLPTDALRQQLAPDQELNQGDRDLCNKLVEARDAGEQLIAFGVRRAFADRVQVTPELIAPRAVKADWEQVLKCFAGLPLTYQVRSRESFVVRDLADLGFRHRVIAQADTGLCVVDETQDPQRVGRVRKGERFDNGLIAFQPRDGSFAPLTVLNLGSISNAPKLILSVADSTGTTGWQGVMPIDMRYSPIDQQLYIVDPTVRGLLQVSLDPLRSVISADRTIQ
jgi:DNA-binding beta-propeller fold protein YncE